MLEPFHDFGALNPMLDPQQLQATPRDSIQDKLLKPMILNIPKWGGHDYIKILDL